MRHVRMLGLCLVAGFALAAVFAVGSASAAPEWGRCLSIVPSTGKAQTKGNYTDPNCTKVAVKVKEHKGVKTEEPDHKGGYEWFGGTTPVCMKQTEAKYRWKESECKTEDIKVKKKKGVVVSEEHAGKYALSTEVGLGEKFTSKSTSAGVLHTVFVSCELENGEPAGWRENGEPNQKLPREDCVGYEHDGEGYTEGSAILTTECEGEHASGEATGTDEVTNVSVRFTGCTSFGVPATSEGLPAGEIQVNPLVGKLGYIAGKGTKTPTVGVLLEPATPGGEFAKFGVYEGFIQIHVGVGNATTGTYYEGVKSPGVPSGDDGVISPITPINTMTHEFKQKYTGVESEVKCPENCGNNHSMFDQPGMLLQYENSPSSFEGGRLEALEAYVWSAEPAELEWAPAGQELENVNKVEGEAEIKA